MEFFCLEWDNILLMLLVDIDFWYCLFLGLFMVYKDFLLYGVGLNNDKWWLNFLLGIDFWGSMGFVCLLCVFILLKLKMFIKWLKCFMLWLWIVVLVFISKFLWDWDCICVSELKGLVFILYLLVCMCLLWVCVLVVVWYW